MINRQNLPILVSYFVMTVLFILTINNGFFWDTVQLGSKHANHYYTLNFSTLLLPESIDSGHIPAFGMYLAIIWKIFGRSLIISHLAMIPFVFGVLWQLQILTRRFVKKEYAGWVMLLVLLDPGALSQLTLISPDVLLVFFFLMGLNSIWKNKKIMLSLAIALLFLTSMRGMMVSLCLLIVDIVKNISFSRNFRVTFIALAKRSLIYMPALLIFILFSIVHYLEKGWIGFHEDSPWANMFARVGIKGAIRNIGILGWRILDYGRIIIWIIFFVLLVKFQKGVFKIKEAKLLYLLFIVLLFLLPANMIWAKSLLCSRYFLPIYLSFSLLCATILFSLEMGEKFRKALIFIWLVVIITGNLWIYPEKIAQDWDSTLGHLPYYKTRQQALEHLDKNNIDYTEVQSFFPNISIIDDIDLNEDKRQFLEFDNSSDYVLYSNVYNISDDEYDLIRNQYTIIKKFRSGRVYFDICKKNNVP